jgi:hypothetical protein
MGAIYNFDLNDWINKHHLSSYIETGAGYGTSIFNAIKYKFNIILSVEIDREQTDLLNKFFRFDPRVRVFNTTSIDYLTNVLSQIPKNVNCFIFLDAHFPKADLGKADFLDEKNEEIRMPLMSELKTIKELRTKYGCKDLILVDDISLYDSNGKFKYEYKHENPSTLPRDEWMKNSIDKIIDMFNETHHHSILENQNGWLLLEPK